MGQDFYQQLGVPETATSTEIRDAYLARVRTARPDIEVNPDHHKIRDLNIAYTVLADPEERRKYDLALTSELCPWCGKPLPANDVEGHVANHDARNARNGCIVCGRLPAGEVTYRATSGLVLWRRKHVVAGHLCRTCSTGVYRAMQARNLARGPWGVVSFFVTPWNILRNWLGHRRLAQLRAPTPGEPSYDRDTGLGRPVSRRPGVWLSLTAVMAVVLISLQAMLPSAGPPPAQADVEVGQTTTTTIEGGDWAVGTCAQFDLAGRPVPTPCGEHFATVVAVVPAASECPGESDWTVRLDGGGVACFDEE